MSEKSFSRLDVDVTHDVVTSFLPHERREMIALWDFYQVIPWKMRDKKVVQPLIGRLVAEGAITVTKKSVGEGKRPGSYIAYTGGKCVRKFKIVPFESAAGGRQTAQITCNTCGRSGDIGGHNASAETLQEIAPGKFASRGWRVGRNEKKDCCPSCLRAKKEKTMTTEVETNAAPVTVTEPVVAPQHDLLATAPIAAPAPQPKAGSSSILLDRRMVNMKLDEVYLDGKGYHAGWTDERVAAELGLTTEFVAQCRDFAYGPASNPALDEIARELAELRTLAQVLDSDGSSIIARCESEMAALKERLKVVLDGISAATKKASAAGVNIAP